QHCINDAEYGAVGANPKGQRKHRNHRKAWTLDQCSRPVSNVLKECLHFCSQAVSCFTHHYSYLSAIIGSTLVARSAGMKQATRATPANTPEKITNVIGSVVLTP